MNENLKLFLTIFIPLSLVISIVYGIYFHNTHTNLCTIQLTNDKIVFMTHEDLKQMYEEYKLNNDPTSFEFIFLQSLSDLSCEYVKNEKVSSSDVISYEPKNNALTPIIVK